MDGWCHESTVLINNSSQFDRTNEFIEVKITVSERQITDPVREVRVIYKTAWNIWERLIPCQVNGVERAGDKVIFRVAFFADIPANSISRYGIVYGNPNALPQQENLTLYVRNKENVTEIDNPAYVISIDRKTGQISGVSYKYFRTGFLIPIELSPVNLIQPGVSIQFEDGDWVTAADSNPESLTVEGGTVAFRHKSSRVLKHSSIKKGVCVSTELLFPASQPYVHIREKVTFEEDTPLYGLRLAGHRFPDGVYSHFTFRPTTKPALKKTEVEEMGHLLIDQAYTKNLPEGTVLSGFMPLLMPWTAMLNIHRNRWFTQVRYLLDWKTQNVKGTTIPEYRAATYLMRENGCYESALMPVYTKNINDKRNLTVIPAGTEFSYDIAMFFSPFEEVVWGMKMDHIGRVMNQPLTVQVHPRPVNSVGEWDEHPVFTLTGKRDCDYQTSGVR